MKITTTMYYLGASQAKNIKEPDKPYYKVNLSGSIDGTLESYVEKDDYDKLVKLDRFQAIEADLDFVRTAKGDRLYFSGFRKIG